MTPAQVAILEHALSWLKGNEPAASESQIRTNAALLVQQALDLEAAQDRETPP